MQDKTNNAIMAGTVVSLPNEYAVKNERFLEFLLEIKRTSGTVDRIPVNLPLLIGSVRYGDKCCFEGEIRAYNRETGKRRLYMSFLVQQQHEYNCDINHVELTGVICKEPHVRITPSGKRICDLILAHNRSYGHSSYLPTIVWGDNALLASQMSVGSSVAIEGRFQSREYQKETSVGTETLTTYEISASRIFVE